MSDPVDQLDEGITKIVDKLQDAQQTLREGENIDEQIREVRTDILNLEADIILAKYR